MEWEWELEWEWEWELEAAAELVWSEAAVCVGRISGLGSDRGGVNRRARRRVGDGRAAELLRGQGHTGQPR